MADTDPSLPAMMQSALGSYLLEGSPWTIAMAQAALQTALYFSTTALQPGLKQPKKRAYILCLYTSASSSLASLSYLPRLIQKGFELEYYIEDDATSRFFCINFVTYLVLDLLIGSLHFPRQLEVFTSWVHHAAYIALLTYAVHSGITIMFMMALPLEIPTMVLAIGSMWPRLRSDNLFGLTFLVFRILYHFYSLVTLYIHCPSPQAWIWQICGVALLPHLYWFHNWMNKYWLKPKPKSA